MTRAFALWRRLDTPGHDACRLEELADGWQIEGTAIFLHEGAPACLAYQVVCDRAWATRRGRVHGWLGEQPVDFTVVRTSGGVWTLNGDVVPGLEHYVDLDLGFTPATNFLQLRRVALRDGESADVPVAWIDAPPASLTVLPQRYERRDQLTYWYESPTAGYAGLLELAPNGFVRRYPGLWEMEM